MVDVQIVRGYTPGSIGRVAELHGKYYYDHWGFWHFFEAKVATDLAEFIMRYDEKRETRQKENRQVVKTATIWARRPE